MNELKDGNRRSIRGQDGRPRIHDDGKTILMIKLVVAKHRSGKTQ